jgi:hypothetical protein
MVLIMTIFAAIIAAAIHFGSSNKKNSVGLLALIYLGAALMWTCDWIFELAQGVPLKEIVFADFESEFVLGLLVVMLGVIIWGAVQVGKRIRANISR